MKLLVDMNLSPHWVDRLNAAGLPAVHWSGIGRMDAPDVEIMAYAAKYDYVVLTHDLDFSAMLAATQGTKPSVVQNSLGQPQSSGHRGPTDRGFTTDGPGVGGRRAAHGRSGPHSTPSAATALQQAVNRLDRFRS